MSSSFSFSRLGKLITKQLFENSRLYIFSALALFGLLALVFAFWLYGANPYYHEESMYIIFIFGLFIAGSIFASMSFGMLGSKDKGMYWLSVPATHFEKLICTILFSVVLFALVYCLCFYLVKSASLAFIEGYMKTHPEVTYSKINNSGNFTEAIRYMIYGYFAVQSLYLLGSIYFSRYSFIVTTVVGAAIIFAFGFYVSQIQDRMLGSVGWDFITARQSEPGMEGSYKLYSVSPAFSKICIYAIQFMWAPLFWIATWYRLKEKEL